MKAKPCRRVLTATLLRRTLNYQSSTLHTGSCSTLTSSLYIRLHSTASFLATTRPKAMLPHRDEPPDHPMFTKRKPQHFPVIPGKRFKSGPVVVSKADEECIERSQLIVRFYDPDIKAKDTRGRTLEDILSWSDSKLESCHNYIQMLFPLPEGSIFNSDAPVVDIAVMQAFRSRDELREQLRRSFERMLSFYGFRVSNKLETKLDKKQGEQKDVSLETHSDASTDTTNDADDSIPKKTASTEPTPAASNAPLYNIVRGPSWRKLSQNWAVPFDHNHLRISRIIRCLRVLGLEREASAFFAVLERTYEDPQVRISAKSLGFWRSAATRPLYIAPDGEKCGWLEAWEKEQANSDKSADLDGDVEEKQEDVSDV